MSRAAGLASTIFALAVVAPIAAQAADPIGFPPPQFVEKAPLFVQEYRSGWYLRGDIGYRSYSAGEAEVTGPLLLPASGGSIDDVFTFGGGAGYKSGWYRADVTIDWSPGASYSASSPLWLNDYAMKIESVALLGNLYFDLGTWYGFTPYVGAGLGAALLRIDDYSSISNPVALYQKENTWNFAWALTGGFSYSLSPGLLLDASYRYLDMGDVESTVLDPLGSQFTVKDITAHEFRVGLRYNID